MDQVTNYRVQRRPRTVHSRRIWGPPPHRPSPTASDIVSRELIPGSIRAKTAAGTIRIEHQQEQNSASSARRAHLPGGAIFRDDPETLLLQPPLQQDLPNRLPAAAAPVADEPARGGLNKIPSDFQTSPYHLFQNLNN